MKAVALRCEYLRNPRGIETRDPRLMWRIEDERAGACQTAYRIRAASSPEKLEQNAPDLWDSGKIDSDATANVAYEGPPLNTGQDVYWRVQTWDLNGEPGEDSETARWEMGLLAREDWRGAQWIGSGLAGDRHTPAPCPYLRRSFKLDGGVHSARLYITALGLYEATINGKPVSDSVFSPGWTDYRRRVQYQVYDVTSLLQYGENVVGAALGDGWYCGHVAWSGRQNYGDRPRLLAVLCVEMTDGTTTAVVTDSSWRWSTGPLVASDMLMGESYDARREMPGWDQPGFNDEEWYAVTRFDDPGIDRSPMLGPPVRRHEEIAPISDPVRLGKTNQGTRWLVDLGQNIAGRVRLRVRGEAGQGVFLRHAEMLDQNGELYTENLRRARATDHLTLGDDRECVYEPRFTFHGFRYVEVTIHAETLSREAVTGIVLHTDMTETGGMTTSDESVNQLLRNIRWGQKGNHIDVPTDCPQRDERLGWTGDAWAFARTAAMNMDIDGMYRKWLRDLGDCQSDNGAIPLYAPDQNAKADVDRDGGPAWSDAMVFCPWTIYQAYNDVRVLENHFDQCKRFLDWVANGCINGIRCHPDYQGWRSFGDWLAPGCPAPQKTPTPRDVIGTAFLKRSAELLSEMAAVLGRSEDEERYRTLSRQATETFQRTFTTPVGYVSGETQTAYVLALAFDLLPEDRRQAAVDRLVHWIDHEAGHLSTGFIGTPLLCPVLTRFGRTDVAYRLLMQDTFPSWLYTVKLGATTMWERWDSWTPENGFSSSGMTSFNHYAYGAVGEWLYTTVAGISAHPDTPGYKRIVVRPEPGGRLSRVSGVIHSIHGPIESAWSIENEQFQLDVRVPPNTSAEVHLPYSGEVRHIPAGRHQFSEPVSEL